MKLKPGEVPQCPRRRGLPVALYPGELIHRERSYHRPLLNWRRAVTLDRTGDGRVETVHALLLSAQCSCSISLPVCRATIRSSSVGTTRTVTAAASLEMTGE